MPSEDLTDDDDTADLTCAERCDFTHATTGIHVTGNIAGSRTVQEFTILTKRFAECYPVDATGYKAEDGSALTDETTATSRTCQTATASARTGNRQRC